jgi:hypothetical protein
MRGILYAKKIFFVILVYVGSFMFQSCSSCREIAKSDIADAIAGNSYAAGRLEATITALDGTISGSRKRIADIIEASRGIADGIERIEYLFETYESEVERLLSEIDSIRAEIEIPSKNNSDGGDSSSGGDFDTDNLIDIETEIRDKDSLSFKPSALAKL